jgi:hypothetical protein
MSTETGIHHEGTKDTKGEVHGEAREGPKNLAENYPSHEYTLQDISLQSLPGRRVQYENCTGNPNLAIVDQIRIHYGCAWGVAEDVVCRVLRIARDLGIYKMLPRPYVPLPPSSDSCDSWPTPGGQDNG